MSREKGLQRLMQLWRWPLASNLAAAGGCSYSLRGVGAIVKLTTPAGFLFASSRLRDKMHEPIDPSLPILDSLPALVVLLGSIAVHRPAGAAKPSGKVVAVLGET